MTYNTFTKKQLTAMLWWKLPKHKNKTALICDGSVRSGKTMTMSVGYVLWASTNFDNTSFAFAGKTIESLRRNVITPLKEWLEGIAIITEKVSKNYVEIEMNGHKNRFYMFGGRDESSASLIQGMTLAGVLLDEVALMPRSFVEQALARCSIDGSTFWFNCNPASPSHWFYIEWIQQAESKNALHLHFTMEDNPSLSATVRERYENIYAGVFYDRFVLGKWVLAEGLIYPQFDKEKHVTDELPKDGRYYVSIDYGTYNPFSAGLWCVSDGKAYRINEYYYSGREKDEPKTDEEYYSDLEKLIGDFPVEKIVIDPSASSFIQTIKRRGRFRVRHANNDVIGGIGNVATLLKAKMLLFSPVCSNAIKEFGLYSWDDKHGEDKPIKDNDHAMDDIRYFVNTILAKEFKWCKWG